MAVGDAHVFPSFLTPVLTQLSFQSHRLLFSHASAEVRGENTPKRNFTSSGFRTHNHHVMSPTSSPLSHPGWAPPLVASAFSVRTGLKNILSLAMQHKYSHDQLESICKCYSNHGFVCDIATRISFPALFSERYDLKVVQTRALGGTVLKLSLVIHFVSSRDL